MENCFGEEKIEYDEYLESSKEHIYDLITRLLNAIQDLDFIEKQQKEIMKINEVANFESAFVELQSEETIFKLCLQTLFSAISNCPMYVRKYMENIEKRLSKGSESLFRNFISPALYLKEVQTITDKSHGNLNS